MKIVTIYKRKNKIIIVSNHRTTDGVWIEPGLCKVVTEPLKPEDIGAVVCEALKDSRNDVPHPRNWNGFTKNLEAAAGVKSYATFLNGTKSCSVELSNEYRCCPYHNGGSKGADKGFHKIGGNEISLPSYASLAKIGQAVLKTLEKCN